MRDATKATLTATLLVLSVVVPVATLGGTVAAEHGSGGNYTVDLPHQSDHLPGDKNRANASIHHLAGLGTSFDGKPSEKGFETAEWLVIRSDDIDFSQCTTEDTAGFGVDRDNDSPGTETDENLLDHRKDSQFNPSNIKVQFFDDDDLAGSAVSIDAVDQIIAVQVECYTMPSEPGWYQIDGKLNGTGYDGTDFEVTLASHYFYICDCDSEQEARQQLGPPPSEQSDGGTDESTPTATEAPQDTATAAPETATATAAPRDTATATRAPQDTPTATATPAAATATPTRQPQGDDDARTATATSESTATAASGGGGGGGNTGGGNAGGGQAAQQTATAAGTPTTPTIAEGPGFGPALALVALAGAALVALRRSDER